MMQLHTLTISPSSLTHSFLSPKNLSRHKTVCNCYGQSDTNPEKDKTRHANNRKTQIKPEFLQKKNPNQTLSYPIQVFVGGERGI